MFDAFRRSDRDRFAGLLAALRHGPAILAILIGSAAAAEPQHAIAMRGTPKYAAGFLHFDYADPTAPKGGALELAALGTFDSLNPLIINGVAAPGVTTYVYETLMARAQDEPFTLYGLLAEAVEVPDDRSSIAFTLNPRARFSDGTPVTAEDVVFTHALLRDHGRPNHRDFYAKVDKVEVIGERTVKFSFKAGGDREIPLIMGLMPVLPKHAVDPATFEQASLVPPVGSGAYVVAKVDPGRAVTYRRNPDYWGADLPVNRGRFNFDTVRYEFYREGNSLFEGFKIGRQHLKLESDPATWQGAYDFPAVRDGRVVKAEFDIGIPAGMNALAFNSRRATLADRRVRQALIALFDFEWANKTLYHGLYTRTQSFFARSSLASTGLAADALERALLAPFAQEIDPRLIDGSFALPVSDGSGQDRAALRTALRLLKEAGYQLRDGVLVAAATGAPLALEVLTRTREEERLALTYAASLKRAGIRLDIRQVDTSQYQARLTSFDYDIIPFLWNSSLSPGNEQNFRWRSEEADRPGSFNLAGVKSPAVDAMIATMLAAKTQEEYVAAVRALDRALLSGDYVLPLFHLKKQWVAHWAHLKHPAITPLTGYQIDTWWTDGTAPSP